MLDASHLLRKPLMVVATGLAAHPRSDNEPIRIGHRIHKGTPPLFRRQAGDDRAGLRNLRGCWLALPVENVVDVETPIRIPEILETLGS